MRIVLLTFLICFSLHADDFGSKVTPFLNKYCFDCHGPKKDKGDLRLDELPTKIEELHVGENWQYVLDELNAGSMPPEDEKQPSADELSNILEVLTYKIEEAKKVLYGKDREVVMSRLNRREYVNTMEDLTGIKIPIGDVMEDQASTDYDTNGKGLFFSSFQFNQYRDLATKAIEEAIRLNSAQEAKKITIEPEESENKKLERHYEGLVKSVAKPSSKTRKSRQKYNKILKEFLDGHIKNPVRKNYLCNSSHFVTNKLQKFVNNYMFKVSVGDKEFKPGLYKVNIELGAGRAGKDDIIIAKLYEVNKLAHIFHKEVQITNHYSKPQKIELELYLNDRVSLQLRNKIIQPKPTYGNEAPFIAIDKIHIEGPLKKSGAYSKIFPFTVKNAVNFLGDEELPGIETDEEKYAFVTLKYFATKAYRAEEPDNDFICKLVDLFSQSREAGKNLEQALVKPLALILSSPKFIYSIENKADVIQSQELANRLSYFLWSSQPDQQLVDLAKTGKLQEKDILKKQVVRMLKDDRALELANGFVPQWLEFHKLQEIDVSKRIHRKFHATLDRSDIKMETVHFFRALASKNLSIENFLNSKFTVANNNLRHYYDLPLSKTNDFELVKFPENSPRGGLLGQTSILVMTGNGERTSPVLRGAFIMSKLMGMPSPEPPPNVPQLDGEATKGLKMREALKLHTEKPQCSSCHKRIDPLGFGLENFDAAGVFSDPVTNERQKKRGLDLTIDNDGQFPNGEKFTNIYELKKILMKYKHKFARSFTEELLSYALGREVGFADAHLVDQLLANTKEGNYGLGDLISEIVLSSGFSQK